MNNAREFKENASNCSRRGFHEGSSLGYAYYHFSLRVQSARVKYLIAKNNEPI